MNINFKRFILISALASFMTIINGCSPKNPDIYTEDGTIVYTFDKRFDAVIDGCDYYRCRTHAGHSVWLHKGNCKACWNRMQTIINGIVLEKREIITNTITEVVTNTITIYRTNDVMIFKDFDFNQFTNSNIVYCNAQTNLLIKEQK
jgi:hypothetical protein